MWKKKDDVEAACKLIHYQHNYSKTMFFRKRITLKLFKEDEHQVSARLGLQFNKNTNTVSMNHSLLWRRKDISPLTYPNKRKCINEHGIKMLENSRIHSKEYRKKSWKQKKIDSGKLFENNNKIVSFFHRIQININTLNYNMLLGCRHEGKICYFIL